MHSISDTVHYITINVRPSCLVYVIATYKYINSKSGKKFSTILPKRRQPSTNYMAPHLTIVIYTVTAVGTSNIHGTAQVSRFWLPTTTAKFDPR
jgi:hypothetical protein